MKASEVVKKGWQRFEKYMTQPSPTSFWGHRELPLWESVLADSIIGIPLSLVIFGIPIAVLFGGILYVITHPNMCSILRAFLPI